MVKYGKTYGEKLLKIKSAFYKQNDKLLKEQNTKNAIYRLQPRRKNCKMCGNSLEEAKIFQSHNIEYFYCSECHHLNGAYEETEEFVKHLYIEDDYGENYREDEKNRFMERTETIYDPKMDFLLENLKQDGMEKERVRILDVGAGSGYFVQSGINKNVEIKGIEVSKEQVSFGNQMLSMASGGGGTEDKLVCVSALENSDNSCVKFLSNTNCNVISMIGVLEHLIDFHEILKAVLDNASIKYLYFSVPLFSFSTIFEAVFQDGYNRHTGGAHTHLFTLDSIKCMNKKYSFQEVARWQFGADAMDLYRLMSNQIQKNNPGLKEIFDEKFLPLADKLQLVIDKNDFCSEVHMLVKK